jgi:hypothetical protein
MIASTTTMMMMMRPTPKAAIMEALLSSGDVPVADLGGTRRDAGGNTMRTWPTESCVLS